MVFLSSFKPLVLQRLIYYLELHFYEATRSQITRFVIVYLSVICMYIYVPISTSLQGALF